MSLADELLGEAYPLNSPRIEAENQAALRRSISTSYYAVFHLLIDAASEMFIEGPGREQLRAAVRRTFGHDRMASACKAFLSGRHKLSKFLSASPPPELTKLSNVFVQLQEARHRADYDTSARFTQKDAQSCFYSALDAFSFWRAIRDSEDARVFLVALLLWKDLRD